MTNQEIINKLEETKTLFAGFAGYYGLRNYKREQNGERKSPTDSAKYDAYGYCADEIERIIKQIKGEA